MSAPPVQNPLERISSIVGWGVGFSRADVTNHWRSQNTSTEKGPASDPTDLESFLNQQNSSNDTLCSENGRLRAEIERLQAELGPDSEIPDDSQSRTAPQGLPQGDDVAEGELREILLESAHQAIIRFKNWQSPALTSVDLEVDSFESLGCQGNEVSNEEGQLESECQQLDSMTLDCSRHTIAGGADLCCNVSSSEQNQDVGEHSQAAAQADSCTRDIKGTAENTDQDASTASCNDSSPLGAVIRSPGELSHVDYGWWQSQAVAAIGEVVRCALQEAALQVSTASSFTLAEETAVLVGEKVALREQVEREQERIMILEKELGQLGECNGMPQSTSAPGGHLSETVARGLSDAAAGFSAVLTPKKVAMIGAEYEVLGCRGSIVRCGESLTSDQLAHLPPGSRVRVMAISKVDPRRVEVVSVPKMLPIQESPQQQNTEQQENTEQQQHTEQLQEERNESSGADNVSDSKPKSGSPQSLAAPVVGWISARAKDGRPLIRPAPREASHVSSKADPDNKEEGTVEVASVTLSSHEWECLHQDQDALMQQIQSLSQHLSDKGEKLVHSFEMKTVLGELQMAVTRARERASCMQEALHMAREELWQHQLARYHMLQDCQACTPTIEFDAEKCNTKSDCVSSSSSAPDEEFAEHASPLNGGVNINAPGLAGVLGAADWDRVCSERETTAAALSAAFLRISSLEHELADLEEDRAAAEHGSGGELQGLRANIRQLALPTTPTLGQSLCSVISPVLDSPSRQNALEHSIANTEEKLFEHRVRDLEHTVAELQALLNRALASEADLQHSVAARSDALRVLLRTGALRELWVPQCGPIQIQASAAAEREALRQAVEEQLRLNLRCKRSEKDAPPRRTSRTLNRLLEPG